MKITVLGATGGVGSLVVKYALEAGHEVTVLVRTPSKLTEKGIDAASVRVVEGNAFDLQTVVAAVTGADVVVSALATTKGPEQETSLRRMGAVLSEAVCTTGVPKVAWCASEGVDGEIPGITGKAIMKLLAKPLADHRAALVALKASGATLVIARPRALNDGPLNTSYTEVFDGPADGAWAISRASVAHFLVKAIADPTYDNSTVALALPKSKKK